MKSSEAVALFRTMADRIAANGEAEFGGAFLVIPPGEYPPIDGMMVATNPSPVVFWSSVQGQVDVAVQVLTEQTAQPGMRGRR